MLPMRLATVFTVVLDIYAGIKLCDLDKFGDI